VNQVIYPVTISSVPKQISVNQEEGANITVAQQKPSLTVQQIPPAALTIQSQSLPSQNLLFEDSIVDVNGVVTLVGDEADPGDSQYYGTDDNGNKGWFPITSGGGGVLMNEVVSGTIDGSNVTFTIANSFSGVSFISLNGQLMVDGVDYTVSGTIITYAVAPDADLAGTTHYLYAGSGSAPVATYNILTESGDDLITEGGDNLIQE